MNIRNRISRRGFMKTTAVASSPMLLASSVLGGEGQTSPSNRTTAALVGVGCLGRGHLNTLAHHPDVELIGISDVDDWRSENGMRIVREGYAAQKRTSCSCKPFHEFRDLVARDDIDAIAFVMGDRWHTPVAKITAAAGKDVFVEKPCALTVDECMTLSQVVRDNRRISQVGLQQRSDATFQFACEIVHEGRLGKISHVYCHGGNGSREVDLPEEPVPKSLDWDRWLGPAPWRPWNHRFHYLGYPKNVVPWSFCRDFGNSGVADGCVHSFDIVNWGLNMEYLPGLDPLPGHIRVEGKMRPKPVFPKPLKYIPSGLSTKYKWPTWEFPNGEIVQQVGGRIDNRVDYLPPGLAGEVPPSFGCIFVGDKGWVSVGRQAYIRASSPELLVDCPRRPSVSHMHNFIEGVRTRKETNCPVERGCEATLCSVIASLGMWLGRELTWDINRSEFVNDPEANRMRRRTPRGDWMLL